MSAVWRLVLSDLAHDPLRTVFSAVGIAAVVMGAVLLNDLGRGLFFYLATITVSNNLLVIDATFVDPSDSTIPKELQTDLKEWVPNPIRQISATFYRSLRIGGRITQLRAAALEDWTPIYRLSLVKGRWPETKREVVIGEGSASANGWQVGGQLQIIGDDFTISGIYRAPGTSFSAVWITPDAAEDLFGPERIIQGLTLVLAPNSDPAKVSQELQNSPALADKYSVILEDSYTRSNMQLMRDMYSVITLISYVAMIGVPLSTYSLTLLSLAERKRALGILRAVGFTHQATEWFLLLRSVTLSAASYLLGLFLARAYMVARQATSGPLIVLSYSFNFSPSAQQGLLFMGITLAFALVGARLSSRRMLRVAVIELLKD